MTIEFIGIAATAPHSETEIAAHQSDPVQPGYLEELARAHEDAGFDRVLVAHSSASPDGFTVADQVLSRTQRLGVLLAPGRGSSPRPTRRGSSPRWTPSTRAGWRCTSSPAAMTRTRPGTGT